MSRSHQAKRQDIKRARRWRQNSNRELLTMQRMISTAVVALDEQGKRGPADLLAQWEDIRLELRRRGVTQ